MERKNRYELLQNQTLNLNGKSGIIKGSNPKLSIILYMENIENIQKALKYFEMAKASQKKYIQPKKGKSKNIRS